MYVYQGPRYKINNNHQHSSSLRDIPSKWIAWAYITTSIAAETYALSLRYKLLLSEQPAHRQVSLQVELLSYCLGKVGSYTASYLLSFLLPPACKQYRKTSPSIEIRKRKEKEFDSKRISKRKFLSQFYCGLNLDRYSIRVFKMKYNR